MKIYTIQAVIYDVDGVLIDSEPLWQEAEKAAFSKAGLNLSTSDCLQTKGMRIDEVVDFWFQKHPWKGIPQDEMVNNILAKLIQLIQMKGVCMKGVIESINYFKSENLLLAIATSSPKRVMEATLNHLDLAKYFPVKCSAEFEEFGKPNPAVYLTAAKQLNVSPESCLVIEDSVSGMKSAHAAGMKVVVIPEPVERKNHQWSLANHQFKSLNEMVDYFKVYNP